VSSTASIKVWDPLVRVFHWSLVLTFAAAYISGERESRWHDLLGYAILALLAIRVIWGFVGTEHARFRDFVFHPSVVLDYAKDLIAGRARRYLGHNPLGGIMVVALLLSLLGAGATGLAIQESGEQERSAIQIVSVAVADDHDEHERDERGHKGEHGGLHGALKETHEFFAHLTLLLVLAHLAGVALSSLLHRENLVRAMITGRKQE
jgi:cytochrome b